MKNTLWVLGAMTATALSSCAADSHGSDAIEPPAPEDIFQDRDGDGVIGDPGSVDNGGREPILETLYFFDDQRLKALCLWPDADSFDDYFEIDVSTGEVFIARGTASIATEEECPADGIATGPLHEELFPSSWCRRPNCEPVAD
jgi:hypothetical protein